MSDLAEFTPDIQSQLAAAELAIQQPRTPFELRHFVVGQHDAEPRQWAQCTLELSIKVRNLRRVQVNERIIARKIEKLERKRKGRDKAELLRIDLEDQRLAVLGAHREVAALLAIWKSFPRQYTRDELNAAEAEYWRLRLTRQAALDLNASGRVGVGNQDALRMAGLPAPGGATYIQSVEQRFLETGKVRMLVAVPTLIDTATVKRDGLRCLEGWQLPATIERGVYVVNGKPVADAYTDAAQKALSDGANFLLTVEDDHLIPSGAFDRLWETWQQSGERSIVGAWYPQKKEPRAGAAIVIRDGRRGYLEDDGAIHEVHAVPMGLTIIPTAVFRELPQPWFVTTGSLTQDSFFSQLAREAGYRLLVDTSVRLKHVCRETGRVYE